MWNVEFRSMKVLNAILLTSLVLTLACSGNSDKVPGSVVNIPNTASGKDSIDQLPQIEFEKTTHDFGKVIQGERVTYSFKFHNSGKSDLVIANISAGCGCTATEYPRTPIKPGESNNIKVTYDSGGRTGFQNKTITIAANTQPSNIVLTVQAQVITPEKNK